MSDIWFEEDLITAEPVEYLETKSPGNDGGAMMGKRMGMELSGPQYYEPPGTERVKSAIRATTRMGIPRWEEITDTSKLLNSGGDSRFCFVRFAIEFDVDKHFRDKGFEFNYGKFKCLLAPAKNGEPFPRAYEVFPKTLTEGQPRKVTLKIGPKLKTEIVEASLGELSTDITIGTVEPDLMGFTGDNERFPYWELSPKTKMLIGAYHLWLILELPQGCSGAMLYGEVEGTLQQRGIGKIFGLTKPQSSITRREPFTISV